MSFETSEFSLQSCLCFLHAIHKTAKNARVNGLWCKALWKAVETLQTVLQGIKLAEEDDREQLSLDDLTAALENVHNTISRFSAMGELQALLGSEVMLLRFNQACQGVAKALEGLLEGESKKCLGNCESDIRRICKNLRGGLKCKESAEDKQLAREVRSAATEIVKGRMPRTDGHTLIWRMLFPRCQLVTNIGAEIQGLEREKSRAKAEKEELEVQILDEVILTLEKRAHHAAKRNRPQPPAEYLCPISKDIMRDPVVLVETGQTYDRSKIEEWFQMGHRTCPSTKQSVRSLQLTPNYALKSLVSTWCEVNDWDLNGDSEPEDMEGQMNSSFMNTIFAPPSAREKTGIEGMDMSNMTLMNFSALMGQGQLMRQGPSGMQKFGPGFGKPGKLSHFGDYQQFFKNTGGEGGMAKGNLRCDGFKEGMRPSNDSSVDLMDLQKRETKSFELSRLPSLNPNPGGDKVCDEDAAGSTSTEIMNDGDDSLPPLPTRRSLDGASTWSSAAAGHIGTPGGHQQRFKGAMSAQEGLQMLSGALSKANRQSFELQHRPRSVTDFHNESDDPPLSSHEIYPSDPSMSGSSTSSQDREDPANPFSGFKVYRGGMDGSCGMPGDAMRDFNADVMSQASFSCHPCSISCCSDSSVEELDYTDHGTSADEKSEICIDLHEFDNTSFASLSTIAPGGVKITPSLSTKKKRPSFRRYRSPEGLNGATNCLFNEDESECGDIDDRTVSTPVLVEMVKSDDTDVAIASANELAIRAYKDPQVRNIVQESDLIERLVDMLAEGSDAGVAAARTLGTLGESQMLRVQIVKSGAFTGLAQMTRMGSSRSMDVASWALNQLSRDKSHSGTKSVVSMSVEVSTPVLVQMLMAGDSDVQASGVLDLRDRLLRNPQSFEDLTKPDCVWTLVDMLEHDEMDVQLAAATLLSLLVFRSQKVHQQVATKAGTVIRLVRLVKDGDDSCAAAAAQVLRTLAHSNSFAREEMLKRDIVPALEHLLSCPTPEAGAREVAAWLLGILGSHSEESQYVIRSGDAVYLLQTLIEVGQPQEIVAASWALQAIMSDQEELGECEVSVPVVIDSLKSNMEEIKVASSWELCRLANGNFWNQMEIFNSGGLTALLDYLKANPSSAEGRQAALVALAKMAKDVPPIPAAICREGGVPIVVDILGSDNEVEKQLAVEVLTVLAVRCPMHQPEVVTEGAVSVLADMLNDPEASVCNAAYNVLARLADSEMSAVVESMASVGVPYFLETLQGNGPAHCQEAAATLIDSIASSDQGRDVLQSHDALKLLTEVMCTGATYEIKRMVSNAVTKLAKRNQRAQVNLQGAGAYGTLVQLLQSRRKAGEISVQAQWILCQGTTTASSSLEEPSAQDSGSRSLRNSRGRSFAASLGPSTRLAVVPESEEHEQEESESDDSLSSVGELDPRRSLDDAVSVSSLVGASQPAPEAPRPAPAKVSLPTGPTLSKELKSRLQNTLPADFKLPNPEAAVKRVAPKQEEKQVDGLLDQLRLGSGSARERAALTISSLAKGDKQSKLQLVEKGGVQLMVDLLVTKSYH